ncbi:hypothetical protein CERSUDRAFT_97591 [Gelatoporia subvermispora B]|uniref:HMG box domain-containing protein n=1 Tax=Ceriporiopsis subvermispora (strain B) TaxID=914234 RepID=M2R7F0_CERS8|nr:hypothetical protein CERSUDRAFT_97591 [Gelatoporia subvermispora B]
MSSSSSPADSVCGWTAPDSYSPLNMSYASLPSYPSHEYAPHPSTLYAMPPDIESPEPRTASQPPAGVERRTKKQRKEDAGYIPRPSNAFIIFRAEFSRKNAQGTQSNSPAQRPHETLSKRAGDAWRKLTPAEKHPYRVLAQKEALDHGRKYPDYVYRPQRKGCTRRGAGTPSRREQVEHHMREAGLPHTDSESDWSASAGAHSPPSSVASSPEPPDMAAVHGYSSGSASSVAPPFQPQPQTAQRPNLSQLELPHLQTSPFSSSSPAINRLQAEHFMGRPRSYTDGASPVTPEGFFALQGEHSEDGYLSHGSFGDNSPMASAVSGISFQKLTLDEHRQLSDVTIIPSPPSSAFDPYNTSPVYPQPSSPLLQRRRAATTSAVPLSPISIFPATDGTWSPTSIGSLSVSSSSPDTFFAHEFFGAESWHESDVQVQAQAPSQSPNHLQAPMQGLAPPSVGLDFDVTPRCAQFPQHAQEVPIQQQQPAFAPALPQYDVSDFHGYAQGLHDFGIQPTSFEAPPFEGMSMNVEVDNVLPMEYNDVFFSFSSGQ